MVNTDEGVSISTAITNGCWFAKLGLTFPLDRPEIEIESEGDKTLFGFIGDDGFHLCRLNEQF